MNAVTERKKNNGAAPAAVQAVPTTERPFVSPEVNIYETSEGYLLQAEMPGVPKDGIEVTLEGNTIILIGRRADTQPDGTVLYRESQAADYRRVFELDPAVDVERISAEMTQGVLTVVLPKAERVKPRKIQIS